jgi:hypothetical protein
VKILALEKEVSDTADKAFGPYLKTEAARVWALYQAGVIREMYFRGDKPTAVLILECSDEEEASALLGTLPLVEAGLIAFDVIPLRPYPGFARLFEGDRE